MGSRVRRRPWERSAGWMACVGRRAVLAPHPGTKNISLQSSLIVTLQRNKYTD